MKYLILLLFVWSCTHHEDKEESTKPTESTDIGTPSVTSTTEGMPNTQSWAFKFHHGSYIEKGTKVIFFASGIPLDIVSGHQSAGSTAVGYISVGSDEPSRSDSGLLQPYRYSKMSGWPEYWLNLSEHESYLQVMKDRIKTLKDRNMDAIYFDNPDIAANTGQSEELNIVYLKKLAAYTHSLGLNVGLNNGLRMLRHISKDYDFFINEQCVQYKECDYYDDVVKLGKPIYGIEYKNRHCKPVKGHNRKLYKTEALKEIESDC